MNILVTGATGHVGLPLVERLLDEGHTVRTLSSDQSPALRKLHQLGVTHYSVDIRDANALIQPFSGVELVFHLAARVSYRDRDWEAVKAVNVEGVHNVIWACRKTKVRRLIHFSSIEAFSDAPHDGVIDETRALVDDDYVLPYPRSKAMGQRLVRQAIRDGLDAIIIYPSGVIGPYDYVVGAGNKVLLKLARQELPVIIGGGFNWVDVRDVVEVALNAALKAPTGASYLAAGHWLSLRDMAASIAALTGHPAPRWEIPLGFVQPVAPLISRIADWMGKSSDITAASVHALANYRRISHERATRELGYQPRAFEETIADTYRWFADQQRLAQSSSLAA